ncbi:MAG: 50S ribosomal protein L13 [Actinomycetia bacterium]|nr:50S ribosomal protein L13 [Actinomycetes bacterium]
MNKTFMQKKEDVEREWLLVDAEGMVLGRMASQVAHILRGKHKPTFTPHVDTGDFVIIINAEKVVLTGKKLTDKMYHKHSGYIGSIKSVPYGKLLENKPEFVVREAIRRMLPKNKLARAMIKKLKIFKGPEHPHKFQKPKKIELER